MFHRDASPVAEHAAGEATRLRVFIVEDSPLVVQRLPALLAEFAGGVEVIGLAADAASAISSIRSLIEAKG